MASTRLPIASLASSLLFAVAGACGGGGSVSFENLPEELEEENCQAQLACGATPDAETCRAVTFPGGDDFPQIEADLEAGLVNYDAEAARECLDLIAPDSCALTDLLAENEQLEEVCEQVFTGTVEEGGACTNALQCAGDADCDTSGCDMQCCQGTCVIEEELEPAAIGEDCSERPCVDGAFCKNDFQAGTQTCEQRAEVGEPCDSFNGCVEGSFCELDFQTEEGTCTVPAEEGESCNPQAFFPCNQIDNYCDPSDTTCKPRKALGEECTAQPDNCIGYAYCDGGSCAMRPVQDESCNDETGPTCLGDLECVSGTCRPPESDPVCPIEGA